MSYYSYDTCGLYEDNLVRVHGLAGKAIGVGAISLYSFSRLSLRRQQDLRDDRHDAIFNALSFPQLVSNNLIFQFPKD